MNELNDITEERRVGTVESANSLYTKMERNHKERERGFALIENQMNGGRPYSPETLAKQGQSWRSNFNFGDAASSLEQAQVSYWRLLHDTPNLLSVEIHDDHPDTDRWGQTLVHNFNRFIEDWGDEYVLNYLQFSRNHLLYGVGPVFFPDRDSARWEPIRTNGILLPDRAKASSSKQELVCIRQEMSISELWDKIRTPKNREHSTIRGWDVQNIRQLLFHAINSNKSPGSEQDLVRMEENIRTRSSEYSEVHGPINLVYMFIKDWDGKVSKMIFSREWNTVGFIFDDYKTAFRSDDISEDMSLIFFEVGDGLYHSVRGFGYKNYQTSMAMNRLKNKVLDRTTVEGLNFKDNSEGTRTTLPITNMGAFNIIPRDLEQVPNYPGSSTIGDALGMVQDSVNWNNARYRDQSQQIGDSNTATQARILANLQSQVEVSNETLYLKQFAKNIMSKQLARLRRKGNQDPDAKIFRERCLKNGLIPEEAFYNMETTVGTGADPGRTSAALQAEIAFQLLSLQGNPYVNRYAATETYVSSTAGASSVKRLMHPEDQLEDKGAVRLAQLENTSLGDGVPIEVTQNDNHVTHIQTHMEPLMAIIGTAQTVEEGQIGMPANGGMPHIPSLSQEQMIALETTLPHIEVHLEFLKLDEFQAQAYQELSANFKQLQAVAAGMIQKIQETAMAFANQQQFGDIPQEQYENPQEFIPPAGAGTEDFSA